MGLKTGLDRFQKIENLQSMSSEHKRIKLKLAKIKFLEKLQISEN